jgi:hypothetical protein
VEHELYDDDESGYKKQSESRIKICTGCVTLSNAANIALQKQRFCNNFGI